jgi:hypothetical protein
MTACLSMALTGAAFPAAFYCQVSSVASSLPLVVGRMSELQGRLARSLAVARRGLELLADQLVALGALNGRASPNKNPLAGGCSLTHVLPAEGASVTLSVGRPGRKTVRHLQIRRSTALLLLLAV